MKEFKKIAVFDLMDEAPEEISDEFLDVYLEGDFKNNSYKTITTQKDNNVLSTWLIEQGYPEGERVLIKISW